MSGLSRQILMLVPWSLLLVLHAQAAAEQPVLTFPQIAVGPSIRLEINIANLGNQTAYGYVWFRLDSGDDLYLSVDGSSRRAVDLAIPPGGSRKITASSASDQLTQVGYAVVMSSPRSRLVGSLVFTTNDQYDVSVPNSPATTRAHVLVDQGKLTKSAVAFLNTGAEQADLNLSLRDGQGTEIATGTLELPPGRKVPRFLQDLFKSPTNTGLPAELTGLLSITSDKPFHLLGLRQRHNGTLASLTAGEGSFPEGGSQIIYLIDSGIDLTTGVYSEEELRNKTVFELTGISKAARSQNVVLRNLNAGKAVTVKCSYFNDQGDTFLSFLLVLECGQTLVMDPFDYQMPGRSERTSDVIFGTDEDNDEDEDGDDGSPEVRRWTAAGFGSGRFLFSANAVGMSQGGDSRAEILYPGEIAPLGSCGVNGTNTGSGEISTSPTNLHICNALPMAFDYLTATRRESVDECAEILHADAEWTALTAFTRTMRVAVGVTGSTCTNPSIPADPAKVFEAFGMLNQLSDRASYGWPTAVVVYNGLETYRLNR